MSKILLPYLATLVVLVLLDAIWLGGVAQTMYQHGIGHLMAATPNFVAAAARGRTTNSTMPRAYSR
jgi:uncharacterized membrane protein